MMIAVCIFFIFCRYVLRDTQEECLAMPLTHAKASGHSLHTIDYTITLYIVWSIIVCCMYIDWHIWMGKASTLALPARQVHKGTLSLSESQRGMAL